MLKKNSIPKITKLYVPKDSPIGLMLPVIFFTVITLFIVRMHIYERNMNQFFWYLGSNSTMDFYSYVRAISIITIAVISIFLIGAGILIQTIQFKPSFIYIPMAVYSFFIILSYIFSDYKEFSLLGYNDRFEGTLTLLAYMVMLFYTIHIVNSEKNVKVLIYSFGVVSAFVCTVGAFQYYGHNLLTSEIGRKILTPSHLSEFASTISSNVSETVIQFLYNQNYVSFYSVLPICLFSMLCIYEKDKKRKVIWAFLAAFNLFNSLGSLSSGGILGLAVSFVVGIIMLGFKRLIVWRKSIFLLVSLFVIAIGLCLPRFLPELIDTKNYLKGSPTASNKISILPEEELAMLPKLSDTTDFKSQLNSSNNITQLPQANVSEETKQKSNFMPVAVVKIDEEALQEQLKKEVLYSNYVPKEGTPQKRTIDYIVTEPDHIAISVQGQAFNIHVNGTELESITYEDGTPFGEENDICLITTLSQAGTNYVMVNIDGTRWRFALLKERPVFVSPANKPVLLQNAPSIGFKGHEDFGTYRGYIWSRALPLLKDTFFIGHGADTFIIYFPQYDYVGRYNIGYYYQQENIVVDKAHNMFLATGVNTGILSLIAFLVLFGYYIVQSFPIYKKARYDCYLHYVGAGIFLGVCGFLTAGLVNDSNVGVMPLFYGLLGTGIAINYILLNAREKKSTKNKIIVED